MPWPLADTVHSKHLFTYLLTKVLSAGVVVKAGITSLNLWQSTLHNSSATVLFHNAGTIKVCVHRVIVFV